MEELSKTERIYGLSLARVLATVSIIACHILQYYGSFLAWWLNIGVDVFLVLSGYLYGLRSYTFSSFRGSGLFALRFYFKEFIKIAIPYYIMLIMVLPLYYEMGIVSERQIVKLFLFLNDSVQGFGHVWFFRYILICYLFIPLWYAVPESKWKTFIPLFLLCILLPLSGGMRIWYCCFLLGLFAARIYPLKKIRYIFEFFLLFFATVLSVYCIARGIDREHWNLVLNNQKLCMGGGIILLCLKLKTTSFLPLINKFFRFSDSVCYELFLVHPLFLSGAFCVMKVSDVKAISILLCLLCIVIVAVLLHCISAKTKKLLLRIPLITGFMGWL